MNTRLFLILSFLLSLGVNGLAQEEFATNVMATVASRNPNSLIMASMVSITTNDITVRTSDGNKTLMRSNVISLSLKTNIVRVGANIASANQAGPKAAPGIQPGLSANSVPSVGLPGMNTPDGTAAIQKAYNSMLSLGNQVGMTGEQSQKLTKYFDTTTKGLADGSVSLKDLRDQAAARLKQLKEYSKEMNEDPNSDLWRSQQATLQDFVDRYDRGERMTEEKK
jgi:hypothetical protein